LGQIFEKMDINIQIGSELESQLRHEAESRGLSLDRHIVDLLESMRLRASNGSGPKRLSAQETALLQKINSAIPAKTWVRYRALVGKKAAYTIQPAELEELIQLTHQIEVANAERIVLLSQLAQLRGITLRQVMQDLGLKPAAYA
jgi:hypothetical protein